MESIAPFLVAGAAGLIPGYLMFVSVKTRSTFAMWSISGLWMAFTAWMLFAMSGATGWDGLGYFLGLLFVSAPAAIGQLVGGVWGRFKREDPDEHAAS